MEFQEPRITREEVDEHRGRFVIEPLDRGFGYTFGNSLRRVLLSSLEGAAVTSVKIEGVAHEFTTLPEADDRVLATSLVAKWRHSSVDGVDWNASHAAVLQTLLDTFAGTYSRALQETLHAMGCAVLDSQQDLAEIRFSAPNKHHFLVDFSGFQVDGLTNDGEIFLAADRPYGLIEAQVSRDDAPPAGDAWLHVPGF